jgi:hypothetical protein
MYHSHDNPFTDASRRKLQITQHKSKVTPSPLARSHNPYARSKTTVVESQPISSSNASDSSPNRRSELQAVVLGRPAVTAVHSSASTTMNTSNNTTTSLLERQHPHRTGRIRRDRQFGSTLEITDGASRSWRDPDTFPEEDGAYDTTPLRITSTLDQVVQALEDDDDEDEALFSYTAFSK